MDIRGLLRSTTFDAAMPRLCFNNLICKKIFLGCVFWYLQCHPSPLCFSLSQSSSLKQLFLARWLCHDYLRQLWQKFWFCEKCLYEFKAMYMEYSPNHDASYIFLLFNLRVFSVSNRVNVTPSISYRRVAMMPSHRILHKVKVSVMYT